MTSFAIAALQLEISRGDNLASLRSEIESAVARFPWVRMAVLGELSAFGTGTDRAEPIGRPDRKGFLPHRKGARHMARAGLLLRPRRRRDLQPDAGHQPGGRSRRAAPQDLSLPAVRDRRRFGRPSSRCSTCRRSAASAQHLLRHVVPGDHAHARRDGRRGDPASLDDQHDRPRCRARDRAHECRRPTSAISSTSTSPAGLDSASPSSADPAAKSMHTAGRGREVFPVEVDLEYVRQVRRRGWHGIGPGPQEFP